MWVWSTGFPGGLIGRAFGERAGGRGAERSDAPRGAERSRGLRRLQGLRGLRGQCLRASEKRKRAAENERARVRREMARRRRGERGSCYSPSWRLGWRAAAETLLVLGKAEKEAGTSTLMRTHRLTEQSFFALGQICPLHI